MLANELAALSAPAVLVLDDYHVIRDRGCHEQVEFLLLHLPPTVQIVLITRPIRHCRWPGCGRPGR